MIQRIAKPFSDFYKYPMFQAVWAVKRAKPQVDVEPLTEASQALRRAHEADGSVEFHTAAADALDDHWRAAMSEESNAKLLFSNPTEVLASVSVPEVGQDRFR